MANPYQHGELKHAAFEALRGASAGLTLEEIAARINEMHENDSEVFQLRRRGRNPLQALAVLLPKTVKPKDPTFERVEDVSNDPSTNWATVRYRLADPTAREDTDEDDDNDVHKHSKKRSRSISNSGTLGFGKRMKQGESNDIDTAVAALLTAANQVNRTAEAEETARAKADLAKATAVVPAPAPAPPPPPPPAPGPPPAPSTFTQPPASDAGALLGGLSQEQVKQLLASINLAKQGSQAMGAQTQEQRISGLLQQRISTLSSAVQNPGVGATNNGLNPLLAALSNLQQNKANAAAMAAGMPVSLPMNLPPPPPPQPVLRQVPLNATGKFPTRTDLINLLQAANEQQQQQQQQHTGLGGLASLPPQGLSNPALAAGLALAQKLAAVKNAQQMAQPQNGISNLSPLMASIAASTAAAPQIGSTVPNAMPNVSAALSNITSLLPASRAPDMAPSIQDTVRGLIKSTISNLGNGERPRPQAPAPEPPKLSGATRGRRDPEVRRMQNREAAQRHRAKHMRERKEKDAECQRLRNEMLDMKECIQKLTGTLKNLIENTEAPTVDVRDAVNLLIQVSEKKLDVPLVGDTAFAGPAATSLMETSPMPANVPPQVVPSVPGVSADPTEHWRPGVGVVEFTAAAVERGLVPRGISVTVNGGSAYMNRDPKHLAAPGTGASGGDDDTADDGDADGVSAATIDEEELDGDAVVDDATNFVVAGAP